MAKAAAKSSAKTPRKTEGATGRPKSSQTLDIVKVCEDALAKLKALDVQQQLQNDIEWCLGSYRADGNPVGLYAMAERALTVFQEEKARKTKGVTAKTISDLEKAIQQRQN
jgi:hypothetical protein